MKTFFLLIIVVYTFNVLASETQTLEGEQAYQMYKTLPGAICTEWNSKEYIVYTKYSSTSCLDAADLQNWTCTIQLSKKNNMTKLLSASCSKEINE